MSTLLPITPCLWFDGPAEEAARFYAAIFPRSKVGRIAYYGKEGFEIHRHPEGSVMSVEFELNGQPFLAMNGGPEFRFNEALSLMVRCGTQEEIDYYWERLSEGGDPAARQCGWLKDKYGVSWQVDPEGLEALLGDPASPGSQRAMRAMLGMRKIVIREIEEAYRGEAPAR